MVTEGQVHVLNEGESVVLECSFHADGYSLFSYPVLWRKQQLGEDVQMNIMGNVNEPFAATNRFEVAFTSLAPRYKFELSVLGLYSRVSVFSAVVTTNIRLRLDCNSTTVRPFDDLRHHRLLYLRPE